MEINVIGKHLEITEPIRAYAHDKAGKLPRFFDRVRLAEIILSKKDSHTYAAEFVVHVDGEDRVVAHDTHEDLYASIDGASDKIERQLHDLKEKRRNPKHPV